MFDQKIILREVDVDRNLCIRINEVKALLDYYPLCSSVRLQFGLLAVTGMRACELQNLKAVDFNRDFSSVTYRVYKPVKRFGSNGSIIITHKRRTVQIPQFLRAELKEFFKLNYHTFKEGIVFGLTVDSLRKHLSKIRSKVNKGILLDPVWKGFVEQVDNITEFKFSTDEKVVLDELKKENFILYDKYKSKYRIGLHSFRRFYVTFRLWQKYKGDLILTSRDIGHSKALDTTYIYSYSPDKIGLPENCSARHTFDYFFNKGKSLSSSDQDLTVTLPCELVNKVKELAQLNHKTTDSFVREALFGAVLSS